MHVIGIIYTRIVVAAPDNSAKTRTRAILKRNKHGDIRVTAEKQTIHQDLGGCPVGDDSRYTQGMGANCR